MAKLTKSEQTWLKKMQALLDECPSDRIAFYTIGDCDLAAFDVTKYKQITAHMDKHSNDDFCNAVDAMDASFNARLVFSNPVESTAG